MWLAERGLETLEDQAVVHESEALLEREQLRQHGAQERRIVAALRELPRPEPAGHLLGGRDVDAQSDEGGVEAAAAAAHDHVDPDPLALENLEEPERRGALDAPGANDQGDAATHAGKLATAESTSG